MSVSGSASITGALSAASTTLANLTVSGPATFIGSTTIAGLTVTGLNRGLTPGSIAFQGASALAQDNANFFYDQSNHRLGIGTTTPGSTLVVAGTSLQTGPAAFLGNVGIGTTTPEAMLQVQGTLGLGGAIVGSDNVSFRDLNSGGSGQWNFYDNLGNQQFGLWEDGGGTTSRGVLINSPGPSNQNGVGDNFSGFRFGGPNNKVFFADNGSISQISSYHSLYISSTVGQGGFASSTPDLSVLTTSGFVGLRTASPLNRLDVNGAEAIGSYAGVNTAPANSLIVSGNVGIGTTNPTLGPLQMASGAYVTTGGVWTNASDRNLKENFATMSPASILQNIDQLPITEWNYKNEDPSIKHIGPVAQDFYSIFHVGNASTSISTIDPSGIALLGIQALDQKIGSLQGSLTGNASTSNLTVYSPANFSGDSVGEARILSAAMTVRVTFKQSYKYAPIVTITPEGQAVTGFIKDKDATGFTIALQTPAMSDTTFDWHSFSSPDEMLTVSDGTTLPIILTVAAAVTTATPLPVISTPTAAIVVPTVPTPTSSSSTPQILGTSTTTSASAYPPQPPLPPPQVPTQPGRPTPRGPPLWPPQYPQNP